MSTTAEATPTTTAATIETAAAYEGKCEFCPTSAYRPACWCSQLVDSDGNPLRVEVLTCAEHKRHGMALAEVTPWVG